MQKAQEKGIFVLSDEVYHNYVYEGEHASALSCGSLDNLIFINSFSKTFAVTGWRWGTPSLILGSFARWVFSRKAFPCVLFPSASGPCRVLEQE